MCPYKAEGAPAGGLQPLLHKICKGRNYFLLVFIYKAAYAVSAYSCAQRAPPSAMVIGSFSLYNYKINWIIFA